MRCGYFIENSGEIQFYLVYKLRRLRDLYESIDADNSANQQV